MSDKPTILFLCPHNAAKSVIAETFFNQMAMVRGLNYHAASAGTDPDDAVMESVVNYMRGGGAELSTYQPRMVTEDDLANATWVVWMDSSEPALPSHNHELIIWSDIPAVSDGVDPAVDVILRYLRALMDDLAG